MAEDQFMAVYEVILLTITTLVILWYTAETFKLRRESENNNKLNLMPVPSLVFITTKAQTKLIDADFDIDEKDILITNVGKVAALNIKFSIIKLVALDQKILFRVVHANVLVPGEYSVLAVTNLDYSSQSGRLRGAHPHPYLIPGMAIDEKLGTQHDMPMEKTHWKNHRYKFFITYENPFGKKYKADFLVDKDGAHPITVQEIPNR
ncbi:MAG TPA: hypothetical protein VD947_01885 [Patescibacteria group bacterium]|nr:hypothetical protein [Patescibacteria group bacterium]